MAADGVSIVHVQELTSGRDEEVKEQTPVSTGFKAFECKLDTLTSSMLKVSDTLSLLTSAQPHMALNVSPEEEDVLLAESEFDPTEGILLEDSGLKLGDLPYKDLFKDTEDCGQKVNKGVAKRVNSACTKKPAKEQFALIQKKYLRPEN